MGREGGVSRPRPAPGVEGVDSKLAEEDEEEEEEREGEERSLSKHCSNGSHSFSRWYRCNWLIKEGSI